MDDNLNEELFNYKRIKSDIVIENLGAGRVKLDIDDDIETTFTCFGCFVVLFGIMLLALVNVATLKWITWIYPYLIILGGISFLFRLTSDNYYIIDRNTNTMYYHFRLFFINLSWKWVKLSNIDRLVVGHNQDESLLDGNKDDEIIENINVRNWAIYLQFPSRPDLKIGSGYNGPFEKINEYAKEIAEKLELEFIPGVPRKKISKRYIDQDSSIEEILEITSYAEEVPIIFNINFPMDTIIFKFFSLFGCSGIIIFILGFFKYYPNLLTLSPVFLIVSLILFLINLIYIEYIVYMKSQGKIVTCTHFLNFSSSKISSNLSEFDELYSNIQSVKYNNNLRFNFTIKFKNGFDMIVGNNLKAESIDELNLFGKKLSDNLGVKYVETKNISKSHIIEE